MFKSLRTRIFVSHLAVVGLVFMLTFIVALIPLRRAQEILDIRRLQELTRPVAAQASLVLQRPALSAAVLNDLLDAQSRQIGARILLLDYQGQVVYDTGAGQPLSPEAMERLKVTVARLPRPSRSSGPLSRAVAETATRYAGVVDGQRIVVAVVPQSDDRVIALSSPVQRYPLGRILFLPLMLSAMVGLLGAIVATAYLSRSIARPVTRLTAAAQAVRAGDLKRRVDSAGDDEVGRLVSSFNSMVERLDATYESQRRLLANIAHELRTPLTSIQGYAQALKDGLFYSDAERSAAFDTIAEESERVNQLLVQILQLARLESGQAEPRLRTIELTPVIDRVIRRHQVEADAKQLELVGANGPVPPVNADEALIDQAIDNLVRNAIEYTPSGGVVRVTASAVGDASRALRVRIRVSDTGPGIASEDIPHVFERFYRRERSEGEQTTSPRIGFGLGLAIVAEIVAGHGGTVAVESQPGAGASFTIDLPVATPREATQRE